MTALARIDAAEEKEEMKRELRHRLDGFENDRHVLLSGSDPTSDLHDTLLTLRELAEDCVPADRKQLLHLVSLHYDVIELENALKAKTHALVARISFAGASPADIKEVQREQKASRKLAA